MYVEATERTKGHTARLISPRYQGPVEQCMEFHYHMYGRDVGTLNVYTLVSYFLTKMWLTSLLSWLSSLLWLLSCRRCRCCCCCRRRRCCCCRRCLCCVV